MWLFGRRVTMSKKRKLITWQALMRTVDPSCATTPIDVRVREERVGGKTRYWAVCIRQVDPNPGINNSLRRQNCPKRRRGGGCALYRDGRRRIRGKPESQTGPTLVVSR